jgi:hypothetical protein
MSNLTNIGVDLGFTHAPIRRLVFCLTSNDSGVANVLTLSNAAVLANWQAKFNTYAFAADTSLKFMASPLVREFAKADVEAVWWEVEDYKVKMHNPNVDVTFSILDPSPYILKNMAALEDDLVSVFLITENCEAIGIKDGANLKPIPIKSGSLSVPPYNPRGYSEGSKNVISFRLNVYNDLNSLVAVTIASADVNDDTDFFSLRSCTATVTVPATTGCVITPVVDDVDPSAPGTAIPVTGIVHGEITLTDQAAPYTVKSLAGSGSLTYLSGVYTVNESSLLTSGHTYTLKISHAGYDLVPNVSVVVP